MEEIPNPFLAAGLTWEWETFPDFMDALDRRERVIDIAAQAASADARLRDGRSRRPPRKSYADDIAQMRRITVEGAGGLGFTTSRTDSTIRRRRAGGSRDADDWNCSASAPR